MMISPAQPLSAARGRPWCRRRDYAAAGDGHARAASGASFTLHYVAVQEPPSPPRSPASGWNLPDPLLRRGQSPRQRRRIWGPDADTGILAVRPIYGPGAIPHGRPDGGAHSAFQPPARRRRGGRNLHHHLTSTGEAGAGDKPSPCCRSMASRCRSPARWICGACLTPVREGTVDHRDTVVGGGRPQNSMALLRSLSARRSIRGIPRPAGFTVRRRRQSPSPAADRAGEDAAGAVQIKHRPPPARRDGQLNRGDQQTARACFIRHGGAVDQPPAPSRRQTTGRPAARPARSDGQTSPSAAPERSSSRQRRVRRRLRLSR